MYEIKIYTGDHGFLTVSHWGTRVCFTGLGFTQSLLLPETINYVPNSWYGHAFFFGELYGYGWVQYSQCKHLRKGCGHFGHISATAFIDVVLR